MFQQTMKTDPGSHAVVIGGSIAGMLTARVLTNHFDRRRVEKALSYIENMQKSR